MGNVHAKNLFITNLPIKTTDVIFPILGINHHFYNMKSILYVTVSRMPACFHCVSPCGRAVSMANELQMNRTLM